MIKLPKIGRRLGEHCRQRKRSIIFPESTHENILQAVSYFVENDLCSTVHILEDRKTVLSRFQKLGLPDPDDRLVTLDRMGDLRESTAAFLEARDLKPKYRDRVKEWSQDPLFQAGYLLDQDIGQSVVAGVERTTADVLRAVIHTVGLDPEVGSLSGCFVMCRQDEILMCTDSAVVIEPTADQLVGGAHAAAKLFQSLVGRNPEIAFLSFSTHGSADHPRAVAQAEAARLMGERFPQWTSDGELQLDAALDPEIRRRKTAGRGSPLKERAEVLVFPNLDAGNIGYKLIQRIGGFTAAGPILLGAAKPYSDLSRGATASDIVLAGMINLLR